MASYHNSTTGEALTRDEAKQAAKDAVRELRDQLDRAERAVAAFEAGEDPTEGFLSFEGVLCHGYDRTGVDEVTVS